MILIDAFKAKSLLRGSPADWRGFLGVRDERERFLKTGSKTLEKTVISLTNTLMQIAIIGAGLTGLTTAYRLAQKKHRVTLFESKKTPGGLASDYKAKEWDWPLENFFHHLFTSDAAAKKLLFDLNLSDKLFFTRPKTSIFYQRISSQFDSPLALLKFPHLSWPDKLRTALATAYLKSTSNWKSLEKTTAASWLKKFYGQKAHQTLWGPLLQAKFGREMDKISMAWFWARIKKRSAKLGYIEGGFQTLVGKLVEEIKKNNGKILLNHKIKNLNNIYYYSGFDRVIVTTPTSVFLKIAPRLPDDYRKRLKSLKMTGALNLILALKKPFLKDKTYWLNINEPDFPFVAVVEHTNFINPRHYNHQHILYVGGYYPPGHRYFKMTKKEIFEEFLPFLKKINPRFNQLSTIPAKGWSASGGNYQLSTSLFAQPVIPVNYSQVIPSLKTPLPGVFLANMQMVYPWDRGINYAIKLGERVAEIVG